MSSKTNQLVDVPFFYSRIKNKNNVQVMVESQKALLEMRERIKDHDSRS